MRTITTITALLTTKATAMTKKAMMTKGKRSKTRSRWSPPSRVVAALMLPMLLFALVDGPRMVEAAELGVDRERAKRVARGVRARGAGAELCHVLAQIDRAGDRQRRNASPLAGRQRSLFADRALRLIEAAGDELFARGHELRQRGVPEEALRRHQSLVDQYEKQARNLRRRLATIGSDAHDGAVRFDTRVPHRSPLTMPWQAVERPSHSTRSVAASPNATRNPTCTEPELCDTPEVILGDDVHLLASQLGNSPARIADWVRRNITFDPYPGALKTSDQVLRTGSGNAVDIASLLIALLRASDVHSRYATGTVTLAGNDAASWLGTDDAATAVRLLNAAGLDAQVTAGAGGIAQVAFTHTWVEAYLSFAPAMGADRGPGGDTGMQWVAVDAAVKRYVSTSGRDLLSDIAANPEGLLADVSNDPGTVTTTTPTVSGLPEETVLVPRLDLWGGAMRTHLEHNAIDLATAFGGRTLSTKEQSVLSPGLPFAVGATVNRVSELSDADRVHVSLRLRDLSGATLLDGDVTASDAFGKRWTLIWQPSTAYDQQVVDAFAGADPFPAYLIDVTPRLIVEGATLAEGQAHAYGWPTELEVTVSGPGMSAQTTVHEIRSGTTMAFVVAGGSLGDEALYGRLASLSDAAATPLAFDVDATIGEALTAVVTSYLAEEEQLQSLIEGATATHLSRRVTVLHAAYEPEVTELLGIPWEASAGSIALYLDRRVADIASAHGEDDDERTSRIATGLVSGALGHQTLEQIFAGQAGSGARALQAANEESVVVTIDDGNCGSVSTLLQLSAEDESAVADLCSAGLRVAVAESPVTLTGGDGIAGFVAVDPATGRTHTGLLPRGGLGRIAVNAATFPTIAATLQMGDDAGRYQTLVAPVETWVRRAKAATEDVAYAFVPGAASLRRWLDDGGDADPVTFLTSVLAVAGTFEALTARPKVMELTASPRIARPEQTIEIAGRAIYADSWQLEVRDPVDGHIVHTASGTDETIASTWDLDQPTQLSDGVYTIEVTATRDVHTTPIATATVQIDGTAPTVAVTSPTVVAEGTAFAPVLGTVLDANLDQYSVEIRQNNDDFRVLRTASHEIDSGALAMFVARDEPVGQYDLRLTAVDHAGNVGQVDTTFFVEGAPHDLDAPVVTLSVPSGQQQGRVDVTVTATDDSDLARAELWLDGERIEQQFSPVQPFSWQISVNGWSLSNGAHTLVAKATDVHGREGASDPATLTTDNYISELRVVPATFNQLEVQPVLTARLGGPTAWTAEVRGVTPEVASGGNGELLDVYWQIDASSISIDGDYIVDVFSDVHSAEVDISLISQNQVPVVTLDAPADGDVVRGLTDIVGSVADDPDGLGWSVAYKKEDAPDWIELGMGQEPTAGSTLAQLDPSLLRNGLYLVRLQASEDGVTEASETIHRIRVDGELKVGHFTISMQDVSVNVGGLPVTVVRTYDSRDTVGGEFGPGWRLELRSAELETGDALDVAMTLPDGRRTTFGFFPRRLANGMYQAEYQSITGVHDMLQPIGNIDLLELEPGVFTDWDGNEYDPQSFELTTVDGTKFTYDDGKLSSVLDRDGNTLTFSEDAAGVYVTSSMGGSLTLPFVGGVIDRVEEPNQEDIEYGYTDGLLTSVIDRNDEVTTFHYKPETIYIDHIDAPGGVSLIQNFYDVHGRLEKHVDAGGNEILYDHDIDGRQEVVTDREGHPTVYVYDDRGLVTSVTDPQGRTTHYEYDAAGNQTAVVDPNNNRTEYEYDATGRVTLVRDALLRETETSYDDYGNVLTSTDALDRVTYNTYDDAGRLLTTTNAINEVVTTNTYTTAADSPQPAGLLKTTTNELGHTTTYEYDEKGRRTKTIYPAGSRTLTDYDTRGNVEWESIRIPQADEALWSNVATRPRVATRYFYDDGGRLVQTESPLGCDGGEVDCTGVTAIATTTTYTPLGQVETTSDGEGHVSRNVYDQQGRLLEVQHRHRDADPELEASWTTSSSFTYDANGQRLTETDEAGRVTRSLYDAAGRLVRTTYPDQAFTATAYDEAGRVTSTTDRKGHLTRFEYDELGRQVAVIDAMNRRTESEYDEVGNLKLTRDPAGRETEYFYDALNRRIRTEYGDDTDTRTEYETWTEAGVSGRLQREIDQLGRKTEFRYDFAGRLISVHQWIDAAVETTEIVTRYEYDVRGNRTAQIDALGRRTEFFYDALDRLRIKKYPQVGAEPNAEYYAYDANGNLLEKLLPSGDDLIMAYDERNRLVGKSSTTEPGYDPWVVSYTTSGQRESVTRGGDAWGWTYEPLTGRLATFTDPASRTLTYGYDANGNRTSLHVEPTDATTTFDYDALNRLTHVHDRNGDTTQYHYDTLKGVLGQVDHANSTITHYVYDELDRVESIQHLGPSGILAQLDYELKANGRRDAITESIAGVTTEVHYGYDDLDRLVSESRVVEPSNPSSPLQYDIEFEYDAVGNRRKQTRDAVAIHYAYDDRDRLQCEDDEQLPPLATACGTTPTLTYTWDENGRLTNKGAESYTWDAEDRMLSHQGVTTTTFAYDIDGIRHRKTQGASTTEYLVDANRTYQEVLEEWTDGQLGKEYVRGMGLLWQEDHASTTQSFFHGDAQMSTRLMTDTNGDAQSPFTYEAFGTDVGLTGQAATPYRYTGQQWDDATGLYYLRARYMDARNGRFQSIDSHGGGVQSPDTLHRYIYARLRPIEMSDPSGLFAGGFTGAVSSVNVSSSLSVVGLNPTMWRKRRPLVQKVRAIVIAGSGWTVSEAEAELRFAATTWRRLAFLYLIWSSIELIKDPEHLTPPAQPLTTLRTKYIRSQTLLVVFLKSYFGTDQFLGNPPPLGSSGFVGSSMATLQRGNYDPHSLSHEIGHAFDLIHRPKDEAGEGWLMQPHPTVGPNIDETEQNIVRVHVDRHPW